MKIQITEIFLQNVFQIIRATKRLVIIQRNIERNISIQNKSDSNNLQHTQNANDVQYLNISPDINIDVIDKKDSSDWNV